MKELERKLAIAVEALNFYTKHPIHWGKDKNGNLVLEGPSAVAITALGKITNKPITPKPQTSLPSCPKCWSDQTIISAIKGLSKCQDCGEEFEFKRRSNEQASNDQTDHHPLLGDARR